MCRLYLTLGVARLKENEISPFDWLNFKLFFRKKNFFSLPYILCKCPPPLLFPPVRIRIRRSIAKPFSPLKSKKKKNWRKNIALKFRSAINLIRNKRRQIWIRSKRKFLRKYIFKNTSMICTTRNIINHFFISTRKNPIKRE